MDHLERLSQNTIYRLSEASRFMREFSKRRLADLGVKPAQINALAVLCDQKLSMPSEVARRLNISRPSVTHLLERMERDGLIQRMKDKENRRRIWIMPTPKGRKLLKAAHTVLEAVEADLSQSLGLDMEALKANLVKLSEFSSGTVQPLPKGQMPKGQTPEDQTLEDQAREDQISGEAASKDLAPAGGLEPDGTAKQKQAEKPTIQHHKAVKPSMVEKLAERKGGTPNRPQTGPEAQSIGTPK